MKCSPFFLVITLLIWQSNLQQLMAAGLLIDGRRDTNVDRLLACTMRIIVCCC
jgi:hypothetical protein